MSGNDAILTLRGLSGGYRGRAVVEDISLELRRGEVTAILGPNGSGQPTLLRLCARLLPPMAGSAVLEGRELSAIPRKELARLVSFLPQGRPVGGMTVGSLVAHGRFPYLGYPRRMSPADRRAAEQAMELAGVARFRDRPLSELSGGQRQKAYLAMALAQDTPLMLLDEPGTYLDLGGQLELLELLRKLAAEGKAVAAVLHDLPQALEWAHRAAVLEEGRLADLGAPGELLERGTLDRVFGLRSSRVEVDGRERYFFSRPLP